MAAFPFTKFLTGIDDYLEDAALTVYDSLPGLSDFLSPLSAPVDRTLRTLPSNGLLSWMVGTDSVPRLADTFLLQSIRGSVPATPGLVQTKLLQDLTARRQQAAEKYLQGQTSSPNTPTPPSSGSANAYGLSDSGNANVMRWRDQILQVSQETGVPAAVIAAIIDIESDGDPKATGPYTGSTYGRARGLMQIMDFHWQPGEDPYDPLTNIRKGTGILKANFDRAKKLYGVSDDRAWEIAAAAYLGGWDWNAGTYNNLADAFGTTGERYVDMFRDALALYRAPVQMSAPSSGTPSIFDVTGGKYPITQEFGRTAFAQSSGMYANRSHSGYDIGVPSGTALYSPWSGEVVVAGNQGDGYGVKVYIRTDSGHYLLLGHLSSVTVGAGQRIEAGQMVGYSGNTGASMGPHVHVEIRGPNGEIYDPKNYFTI